MSVRERRLMVMRHAKSSWKSDAADDHERPLNERGRRDAPRIAEHLAGLGYRPELVLSSTSVRTRQTWQLMADRFPDAQVLFTETLYLSDVEDALRELAKVDDDTTTVLMLGHNPGFEDLVEELAGGWHRMTTANVALFTGRGESWARTVNELTLVGVVRPKEL